MSCCQLQSLQLKWNIGIYQHYLDNIKSHGMLVLRLLLLMHLFFLHKMKIILQRDFSVFCLMYKSFLQKRFSVCKSCIHYSCLSPLTYDVNSCSKIRFVCDFWKSVPYHFVEEHCRVGLFPVCERISSTTEN